MSIGRAKTTALAAAAAAGGAWAAYRAARALPPRAAARFERTNHAGRAVTLLEGPAYVVGAALGASAGGAAPVVATLGAGALGALDDLAGDGSSKGLRGHVRAAARGEITTGVVKIVGLAATGAVSAGLIARRQGAGSGNHLARAGLGGAVVAGSANLLNLFDLRPGRALKVTTLAGAVLAAGPTPAASSASAAVGAALALLPVDLRGEAMLGDTGANAAGALLGVALVQRLGPRGQLAALAVLTGLTLASEKVSFTQVIERTPVLRELDRWGRT